MISKLLSGAFFAAGTVKCFKGADNRRLAVLVAAAVNRFALLKIMRMTGEVPMQVFAGNQCADM